jgi:voltage-gated sodium channel
MSNPLHEKFGFELTVAAVIVLNTTVAVYALLAEEPEWLDHVETACLAFFVLELLLRIKHHGLDFFRSAWSWVDSLIIVLSLLPFLGVGLSVLRVGRLARLVHLGRHISGLRAYRLLALAHWRATHEGEIQLVIDGGSH